MMPDWCLDAYLTQQSHFSLKELINTNLQAFHHSRSRCVAAHTAGCRVCAAAYCHRLQHCLSCTVQILPFSTSIGTVPTKLMCFTRSTPSIHHLPAVYATLPSSAEHEALMKDMIIDEVHTVVWFMTPMVHTLVLVSISLVFYQD